MKKITIIDERNEYTLEHRVNQIISEHNVIDIQFQYTGDSNKHFAVMIVYEED